MNGTYAGSYGRVKSSTTDFLSDEFMRSLIARSPDETIQELLETSYKEDLDALSSVYSGNALLENAINRHILKKNKLALFAPPPGAKDFLKIYLSKWDIENIKILISSKVLGHEVKEDENFIISFRDIPMGIFGGNITQDEFKGLIGISSIEGIVESLSRFPVGVEMLKKLDEYRRVGDVTVLFTAMDTYYYSSIMESLKFINGDEEIIRNYFRETIDSRNFMVLLKAKEVELDFQIVKEALSNGGNNPVEKLEELYRNSTLQEIMQNLIERFSLVGTSGKDAMTELELRIRDQIYNKYHVSLSSSSISINSIFDFIIRAERERNALRSIVIGNSYRLPEKTILSLSGLLKYGE